MEEYCPECGGLGEQEFLREVSYKSGELEEEYFCHLCGSEYSVLILRDTERIKDAEGKF